MLRPSSFSPKAYLAAVCLSMTGSVGIAAAQTPAVGTPEDRAALFDYLIETTHGRDALSPYKHPGLADEVEAAMRQYRSDLRNLRRELLSHMRLLRSFRISGDPDVLDRHCDSWHD